jgi:xanthine dehydrogenase small subunit
MAEPAVPPTFAAPPAAAAAGRARIRFLLNDRLVSTEAPGGLAVLDFVRRHAGLTGTKEGCKEGDCGACVVLVGELAQTSPPKTPDGRHHVRYLPVTSCLMPLAELDGRHLVTIEGLDLGRLSVVQRAIVDEGASQCGFCTPGIVVSLTALRLVEAAPALLATPDGGTEHALSGHLCRCTGYRSLRAAGERVRAALGEEHGVAALVARGELPAWFLEVPARLAALGAGDEAASTGATVMADEAPAEPARRARELPHPSGRAELDVSPQSAERGEPAPSPGDDRAPSISLPVVAGGTDLYVQRGDQLAAVPVRALAAERRGRGVWLDGDQLVIGALTSFEELATDPLLLARIPALPRFLEVVASWQIRNRATVGGNLMNASPIGDVSVLLLALGGTAVFVGAAGSRREVPLRRLFLGYKRLDRGADEVLVEVRVPDLQGDLVEFDKVAKRRHLDIASVNSAVRLRLAEPSGGVAGPVVAEAGLAVGGVAPVPLYLARTSALLAGRVVDRQTVAAVLDSAQAEIAPISDIRGAAPYKRLLVRQLLLGHFASLFPGNVEVASFYEGEAAAR